jgi:hypothetical protein
MIDYEQYFAVFPVFFILQGLPEKNIQPRHLGQELDRSNPVCVLE